MKNEIKSSFTPGPWKYHLGRGANPRLHIHTVSGYQIASTTEVSRHKPEADEQQANARLIAAAPELLAAAIRSLAFMEQRGVGMGEHDLRAAVCVAMGLNPTEVTTVVLAEMEKATA